MHCEHCFRGDAENIDMSDEVIDSILDKTEVIYHMMLTGGEITLIPEKLKYVLDGLRKRNIPLLGFEVTTNGKIQSDEIVEIIKGFRDHIAQFIAPEYDVSECIGFLISDDSFHEKQATLDGIEFYVPRLRDSVFAFVNTNGGVPSQIGRGKNIPYALQTHVDGSPIIHEPTKVEYMTYIHIPPCAKGQDLYIWREDQLLIPCAMYVSADGKIYENGTYSYEDMRTNIPPICDAMFKDRDELIHAIDKFNMDKSVCNNCIEKKKDSELASVLRGCSNLIRMNNYLEYYGSKHPNPEEYKGKIISEWCISNPTLNEVLQSYISKND